MALGFRKRVVLNLLQPHQHPPSTAPLKLTDCLQLLRDGFCALGIMSLYFMPTLWLSWCLGTTQHSMIGVECTSGFLLYAIASISFPPLTLGGVHLYYQLYSPLFHLSVPEGLLVMGLLLLTTFILPLGFMQIGFRAKWRDALHLPKVFSTLLSHPKGYLRAWRDSIRLTLSALSLGLHTPWGIVWSYQGIVWLFNHLHLEQFPHHSFDSAPLNLPPDSISRLGVPVPVWWRGNDNDRH